jgi:phosphonoacetate hydrolase
MMNDPKFLRCGTIFAALAAEGVPIYAATAKNKLLKLIMNGIAPDNDRCFGYSAEKADSEEACADFQQTFPALSLSSGVPGLMGKDAPHVYDPQCSIFTIESGAHLLKAHAEKEAAAAGGEGESACAYAPVMYLSTTDFVQHKYAPEDAEAIDFYAGIDAAIGTCAVMCCGVPCCAVPCCAVLRWCAAVYCGIPCRSRAVW